MPAAPVRINLAVHPGDHLSTRVTVEGSAVDVSVSNQTTGQSFSKQLTMNNPDASSAEWVAEAPSSSDGSAFSVAYSAGATTTTTTAGKGYGYGYGVGSGYSAGSDGGYGYGYGAYVLWRPRAPHTITARTAGRRPKRLRCGGSARAVPPR